MKKLLILACLVVAAIFMIRAHADQGTDIEPKIGDGYVYYFQGNQTFPRTYQMAVIRSVSPRSVEVAITTIENGEILYSGTSTWMKGAFMGKYPFVKINP